MMRHSRNAVVLCALWLAPTIVRSQLPDTARFAVMRVDGNGIAALQTTVRMGFTGESAASAFMIIARAARLNITFSPELARLQTPVIAPAAARSAAAALLDVAGRSSLQLRVSSRGDIVVVAVPRAEARSLAEAAPRDYARALAPLRIDVTPPERRVFEGAADGSRLALSRVALHSLPAFVEPDLLRSIKAMPGITVRSDWAATFNVRGGESDQTLILLDGYPIYNPFHFGGVFSTFMEPMVDQVDLYSGTLPARHGGRLSAVLDVRSASAEGAELHGSTQVSLLSATTSFGRTFANGGGQWMVGARRTYADALVNLASPGRFPYHFQDLQGHVSASIGGGLRLDATGYTGRDVVTGQRSENGTAQWGNNLLGLTVSKLLQKGSAASGRSADSATFVQRFSMASFAARVRMPLYSSGAENTVTDFRLGGAITAYRATSTAMLGYELARQQLAYAARVPTVDLADVLPIDSLDGRVNSFSVYSNYKWRPTRAMLVDLGARWESVSGASGTGVSPRVAVKYFVTSDVAVTFGAGRYTQWLHSLGREESPFQPLQFWVGADGRERVSRAMDASLGAERWLTVRRMVHVGAFYKRYDDLTLPNQYADPRVSGDAFFPVRGSSYGMELLLRELEGGPFSGWLSYAWTQGNRISPSGLRYTPTQDRPHNLSLVGTWRRRTNALSLHVQLASGTSYTPVLGNYERDVYSTADGRWLANGAATQILGGPKNSARLPFYNRVDVSLTHDGRLFNRAASMFVSVVNVLNAKNPAGYVYFYNKSSSRGSVPNLPFIPTLGVTIAY